MAILVLFRAVPSGMVAVPHAHQASTLPLLDTQQLCHHAAASTSYAQCCCKQGLHLLQPLIASDW
jgi:hypothetical protein